MFKFSVGSWFPLTSFAVVVSFLLDCVLLVVFCVEFV